MNRFSPEFAEKLRKRARQVGNKLEFIRARQQFGSWVAEGQNMMAINVFAAHYSDHIKYHCAISAQDDSTEAERPPTVEEEAVERVRMAVQFIDWVL